MTTKTFDEFIKKQVAQANQLKSADEIDWPTQRDAWLDELEKLHSDMENYLKKYLKAGSITVQRDEITVTEPTADSYVAKQLTFYIGTEKVVARPIGTLVVGTYGRVDLIGRTGSIKIVLLEKGGPALNIKTSISGQTVETNSKSLLHKSIVDKKGWYFVSSPPRITATAFDKESFEEAIMELADV